MTELFNELFLGFKDFAYAHETWFIILSYSMFFVGLFANVAYFILILISAFSSKERSEKKDDLSEWWLMNSDVALPVSIIVPAYNEEEFIVDNVHSLLSVEYPSYEVIIVNDGSTDTTLDLLKAEFDLTPQTRAYEDTLEHRPIRELYGSKKFPHLLVIDKENGGKGDAQNAAIVVSRNPLFCIVDADTTLQGEALLRVVQPFIEDTSVVAAGAALRVGNGCTIEDGRIKDIKLSENFVPLCQTLEYLRSFFIGHLAWSKMNMVLIISGAFGLFRRDIVTQTGGYVRGTFSEDLEMALNIQKMSYRNNNKYKIRFVPETVCWTDAPRRLGPLCSQRVYWHQGLLDAVLPYWRMLFNPRYGKLGFVGIPYLYIVDVIAPILEGVGYILIPLLWAIDLLSTPFLLAYLSVILAFGIFMTLNSIILEEMQINRFKSAKDLLTLTLIAILENIGYRQICNLMRVWGSIKYFFRDRKSPKHAQRKFSEKRTA